jgi:hypothetical protein
VKSLARIVTALLVEGTAAAALAFVLFFSASGASPDEAIRAASSHVSDGAAWLNGVLSADRDNALSCCAAADLQPKSETEVAGQLDHAAADLGALLECELERILAPFTGPDPRAAARSD